MSTPTLPQLDTAGPFVTDGGLETTLVFHQGIDLPDFAAFPLVDDADGVIALEQYYASYLEIADGARLGFVLDTPTWRANADWGARLGYDRHELAGVNRRSVDLVRRLASGRSEPTVLNGVIGPRGDGYVVSELMSPAEAARYHGLQARAFADAGADMITAVTMTHVEEAIGITRAARAVGLPVAISLTVETDGRLPSGQPLGEAIEQIDAQTDGGPAYHQVNCAHPDHFAGVLTPGAPWLDRIKAIRANASRLSHEELDAVETLDRGDPVALAEDYVALHRVLPDLRVVGGCCGTDHEHIAAISRALLPA